MKKSWTWKKAELPPEKAEKLLHGFELSFFQKAAEHDPDNVDILVYLGDAYSKRGLTAQGLEIDRRLVRLCPEEPTFHYNLACSYSLLGDTDAAFQALHKAIQLGYQNFEHLQTDTDLDNLRKDNRFTAILKDLSHQS